jgi:hypothetical protein
MGMLLCPDSFLSNPGKYNNQFHAAGEKIKLFSKGINA